MVQPKSNNLRLIRTGLPFFTIVFGGAFILRYFQQVRYDFRKVKKQVDTKNELTEDLEKSGLKVNKNITLDAVANEIFNIETENWENIRGPRGYEDNTEYLRARAKQQSEAKKRRAELKAQLLKEQSQYGSNSTNRTSSPTNSDSAFSINSLRLAKPHKMVFVVNTSLKMGVGKLAAQVGHATLGVYCKAMKSKEGQAAIKSWNSRGAMKVVLKGTDANQLSGLQGFAKEQKLHHYLVQDAGHTQIPAGSVTVLGLFGPVEDVDQVTGNLKLL